MRHIQKYYIYITIDYGLAQQQIVVVDMVDTDFDSAHEYLRNYRGRINSKVGMTHSKRRFKK